MPEKTVLITGGTGLLGQGLCATAPSDWSVISVHVRTYPAEIPGVVQLRVDVRDRRAVEQLFAEYRFDAVVHAAGNASVDYSEKHYEESLESNVTGTRHIVGMCRATGTRLIYVSSNAVFDGSQAPYRESDIVNPVNAYGRIKVSGERVVTETLNEWSIVRPILMYGWPHEMGRPNPVTWVIDALERGETLRVVDDVFENPLYNVQGGRAIWTILARGLSGVFHVAGRDVVSRYELARLVAHVFELDASRIRPVPSACFPHIAPRPRNTTFETLRMVSELALEPLSAEEGLRLMAVARTPVRP